MRPIPRPQDEFVTYKKILHEKNPFYDNGRVERQNTTESSIENISA